MSECPCQKIEIKFEDLSENLNISLDEIGGLILESTVVVYRGTTREFEANPDRVSDRNALYLYTDHVLSEGKYVPGLKVGDGKTLLKDLPFIGDDGIRISNDDIASWNTKWTGSVSGEKLVFRT